jgi:hypothetical protein
VIALSKTKVIAFLKFNQQDKGDRTMKTAIQNRPLPLNKKIKGSSLLGMVR